MGSGLVGMGLGLRDLAGVCGDLGFRWDWGMHPNMPAGGQQRHVYPSRSSISCPFPGIRMRIYGVPILNVYVGLLRVCTF